MSKGITAFLREAIDCYESDPGATWEALDSVQTQLRAVREGGAFADEESASKTSMERTGEALKAMLLERDAPKPEKIDTFEAKREMAVPASIENPQVYLEYVRKKLKQAHFDYLLDVLVWKENQDRKHEGKVDATRQEVLEFWGEDEILSIEECIDWYEIAKEYELALRTEPDFEMYLLRKHLDWLDSSAGKIEADGPISFRNSIPEHLKLYIYEANWCNLHGFDAACASLCGAVLEEALRMKLRERNIGVEDHATLGTVIEIASNDPHLLLPLLIPRARDHAREVMRLRNLTAHGSREFTERSELDRKASLHLTIELLETLFTPEG
ncbi:MAG TPA: hypothetical protein VKG86_05025 [Terracidiphilus sp.]|nr:hypothetical protein [Terracidiphilus sp.]